MNATIPNPPAAAPRLAHTDDAHLERDLVSAPVVLLKFTGAWCGPCRALEPTLERLSRERPEVRVLSLDVDLHPLSAQRFGVRSVPTLIAFREGRPVGQLVGNVPRARIDALLGS